MPQFSHVFSGDGYSAGYYSYLWADTLSADAFEAFTEAKGPYDTAVAARLKKHVFSAGNTVDPAEAYRAFRGRDAGVGALMRKRGFPVPKAAPPPRPHRRPRSRRAPCPGPGRTGPARPRCVPRSRGGGRPLQGGDHPVDWPASRVCCAAP